jgi:selenocysteine-specific elongation factor
MTIDLGFAWMSLPSGSGVAFVDVPGHERFVTTMLAGVGPVPAVCLVVAADEGWKPQTDEHVRAFEALRVTAGVVVVTKTDLAAPESVVADVRRRLATTGLAGAEVVPVSAVSGAGLVELTNALDRLVNTLPTPAPDGPVRLWVDRAFTITGAGTVVTGTLPAGTIATGDSLIVVGDGSGRPVTVRGLQSHNEQRGEVSAVARVAVNLRGVGRAEVARGMALVTPDAWSVTSEVDALLDEAPPTAAVVHVGSAAVPVRARRLDADTFRLRLHSALPLHLGDRLVVRDPSSRRVTGATVVDVAPVALRRRGDAQRAAASLAWPRTADDEVKRCGLISLEELTSRGLGTPDAARVIGGWAVSAAQLTTWQDGLAGLVGSDATTCRRMLGIPTEALLKAALAGCAGVVLRGGRLLPVEVPVEPPLPPAVVALLDRLETNPFEAPTPEDCARLGIDLADVAAAADRGRLLRLAPGVYVGADAVARAVEVLRRLPQPFTVSQARQAMGSSRRVVVPLLEHLDAARRTRRDAEGLRVVVAEGVGATA